MLITKISYKKKYAILALVSSIRSGTFFTKMFSNNTAKQLASTALQAGKTEAKDIGMKAVDVGKQLRLMLVRN